MGKGGGQTLPSKNVTPLPMPKNSAYDAPFGVPPQTELNAPGKKGGGAAPGSRFAQSGGILAPWQVAGMTRQQWDEAQMDRRAMRGAAKRARYSGDVPYGVAAQSDQIGTAPFGLASSEPAPSRPKK